MPSFYPFGRKPRQRKGMPACRQGRDECFLPQGEAPNELNPENQEATAVIRQAQDGSKDDERSRTIRRWSFTFFLQLFYSPVTIAF
jgi:hypothetical protein